MANKTFNNLTVTTSAASDDLLPIWRAANNDTRKITKANFMGGVLTGAGTVATGGFTLTVGANSTINGSLVGNMTGSGTLATGGFTLTLSSSGTLALAGFSLTVGANSTVNGSLVGNMTGGGTVATGGFTLTVGANSTINGSLVGSMTGAGTIATGGFTGTLPATGTLALINVAQTITAAHTFSGANVFSGSNTFSNMITKIDPGAAALGYLEFLHATVRRAIFGISSGANALIPGSVLGDLIIRAANKSILFSVDDGTTKHASLSGAGDLWVAANMSALTITDRTKGYEGDALSELARVKAKNDEIDHDTLPAFARYERVDDNGEIEVGRDLGAMISMLTVAVQQLTARLEKLEKS